MRTFIYFFILVFLISGCAIKPKDTTIVTGVFTTFRPGILETVLIDKQFAGHVFPLPAAMIYLRQDGTYVMGFCDNQVNEAGRYAFQKDSVRLYDRYDLEKKARVAERTMYFDHKDTLLYFTCPDPYHNTPKRPNEIIPLKKDHVHSHAGFLRGQEMSLDSLLRYYQQRSVKEQNKWSDSVWHLKHPDTK